MLVAGVATGFQQSDAAGVDALEGRGIDERAVAQAGGAGTVKFPRHQIIAIGGAQAGIMLECSAFQALFTCPSGAAFAQRGHRGRVAPGFAGDVTPVAQGVQPPADTGQSPIRELADGGQDRPDVIGHIQVADGLGGDRRALIPTSAKDLVTYFAR